MVAPDQIALPRVILHLDMDAFYASVEARDDPSLAGLPLIIGHRGRRGVVSTCSYEARRFGVRSAMPSVTAARLCPSATWRPGRMARYLEVSRAIRLLLDEVSPVVEPLSIDEAFVDLTGVASSLEAGAEMARQLKNRITEAQQLPSSAGVAPNKFLAKVASDLEKPDGLVVLAGTDVETRLWPLPVSRLWGVGPRTASRLQRHDLHSIGDVATATAAALEACLGPRQAAHLRDLAHGRDSRPVMVNREARSISEERTYASDLSRLDDLDRALVARAEGVARQLRRQGMAARTVHLKVRAGDFTTWTRSRTLTQPTDLMETILETARTLLAAGIPLAGRGVRLLGVAVSGLAPPGPPSALFVPPGETSARRLARATDAIRTRFGETAVTRARLGGGGQDSRAPAAEASSLPAVD